MLAVIATGGKQYLVKEADEILVDKLTAKVNDILWLLKHTYIELFEE